LESRATRVLRIIARMNVGGPSHHVSILSEQLDSRGYKTKLVCGSVGPGEASAEHLATDRGVPLTKLAALSPEIRPLADARALLELVRIVRRFRPDIVHTHTAKAGFVGRLAARLALRPRPKIVHTYHGHVLEGYFGRVKTGIYRLLERLLARPTDVLIGVSQSTVDDLVRLRIAPPERFRVVPLGLELRPFFELPDTPDPDAPLRRAAGVREGEILAGFAGRLVPIKRVDVALEALARARAAGAPVRLLVAGDGELRGALEERAVALGVAHAVHFAGFIDDMPALVAACDLALLTSENEGTPVAIIEAAAGARPAIATDVGGIRSVVTAETGSVRPAGDVEGLAADLVELASDGELRGRLGRAARMHVAERFDASRLVGDIDDLYRELLRRDG